MKNIYIRYIKNLEQAGLNVHLPKKVEQPFEWGLEHLGFDKYAKNAKDLIYEYTKFYTSNSSKYFLPSKANFKKFNLDRDLLTFPSDFNQVQSIDHNVYCKIFPAKSDKAAIVIPNWNAGGEKFDKLCLAIQKSNITAVRLSMPYHDQRMPPGFEIASLMVSANVGLTIRSMQHAVRDVIRCVDWLEYSGFKKIGIVGTSLGSCVGFFSAVHDNRVRALINNLMSSYFGEVVWTGLSTAHIRQSLQRHVTLEDIRNLWLLNSPVNFVNKIKSKNPKLKHLIISGKYDTTFRYYLTKQVFREYRHHEIKFNKLTLPCGHYSLGKSVFKYIDAITIIAFLHKTL